ncbi:MAG: hypothetical protein SPI74_03520 [Eubacterium sp.]|nr:hypothetical protein [Eubacterium sp.]
MLKILIKLRILEILNQLQGKKSKKVSILGLVAIYLISFAALAFLFSMIFLTISLPYHLMGLDWLYFAFCGVVAFSLCFIGSVFLTQTQIYAANDNETLLAMPIKPGDILLSRILSLLGLNYIYTLIIAVPAIGVHFYNAGFNFALLLTFAVGFTFLPILSMALSMLFGWIIAWLASKVSRPKLIITGVSLFLMLGYFYLCFAWQSLMQKMAQSGESVAEIFKRYLTLFYVLGKSIADVNIIFTLLFIVMSIVPFAIISYLISRSFIKIATSKKSAKKIVYREGKVSVRGVRKALLIKEFSMFMNSPTYILNAGVGLLFLPLISIYFLFGGESLTAIQQYLSKEAFGLLVCMGFGLSTGMVTISSPSFSLEAKTLWILKSLPIRVKDIIHAKLAPHILFSLPFILFSTVLVQFVLDLTTVDRVMVIAIPIFSTTLNALIGLLLGMRFPKFNWVNEATAIKQSSAPLLAMLLGTAVNAVIIGSMILFYKFDILGFDYYTQFICAVYIILSLICLFIINRKGESLVRRMQN